MRTFELVFALLGAIVVGVAAARNAREVRGPISLDERVSRGFLLALVAGCALVAISSAAWIAPG